MKKKNYTMVLAAFLMLLFVQLGAHADVRQVAVESVINSPASYEDEVVKVEGLVTTYIPSNANSTAYYLLRGDFGGVIRVNTSGSIPVTNQKYCITGIVYLDRDDRRNITRVFISEQSKYEGSCNDQPLIEVSPGSLDFGEVFPNSSKVATFQISNIGRANLNLFDFNISNKDVFELEMPASKVIEPGNSVQVRVIYTPKERETYTGIITIRHNGKNELPNITVKGTTPPLPWWQKPLILVIIAAGILLVVLLIVLLATRKKTTATPYAPVTSSPVSKEHTEAQSRVSSADYETIVVPKTIPMTLKVFPGEFEITTGADAGKKFKMPGHQTDQGLTVTVGREKPSGDLAQFHIQLKENTVGRKQAQFIYKDRTAYLKNLGTTNYSVVDGKEVLPEESVEIKSGSLIKFGDVTLRYTI